MARLARMDEEGRRAGRCHGSRDLAPDMARFAHARDDDAPARPADQGDRRIEIARKARGRACQGSFEGRDAGTLKSKRAKGRPCGGQGIVKEFGACAHGRFLAPRRPACHLRDQLITAH